MNVAFTRKVINTWGSVGRNWLEELPTIIDKLSKHWSLSEIQPVSNMSYNYVALANQNDDHPVVLKVSCDEQLIEDESRALKHFNGEGSIKLIDIHTDLNALLLEQAIPGYLLKEHHPKNVSDTINIYAKLVKALASRPAPAYKCQHVEYWCLAIDRIDAAQIEQKYIQKAKELRAFLLSSADKEYLCHGDLHLENIIEHGNRWLSIDPKGIIGEVAFEAAAFDLIDKNEWRQPETIEDKIVHRVDLLANALDIDNDRLFAWIFLRVTISAQWFIEDNGDPREMINLVSILYPLLKI